MSTTYHLSQGSLGSLVQHLIGAGTRVVAPAATGAARTRIEYRDVHAADEIVLGGGLPARPLKSLFLPYTEPLFRYHQKQNRVTLEEVPTTFTPTVVIGSYPCDAAAVQILDRVMGWDYRDELWFGRREATTIVSLACNGVDDVCFCTAVGYAPAAGSGSDVMLTPVDGGWHVQVLTEKGAALVASQPACFGPAQAAEAADCFQSAAAGKVAAHVKTATAPAIRQWLESHFEHDLWKEVAVRCHGCGACASTCPTCHCFDIVDEPEGVSQGTRRRNWDTCQTPKFTVHGSGHNPRAHQGARIRQRLMHKFAIYPNRFDQVLCTGCGRCARGCPGGMHLPEVLERISALAAPAASPAGGAA